MKFGAIFWREKNPARREKTHIPHDKIRLPRLRMIFSCEEFSGMHEKNHGRRDQTFGAHDKTFWRTRRKVLSYEEKFGRTEKMCFWEIPGILWRIPDFP